MATTTNDEDIKTELDHILTQVAKVRNLKNFELRPNINKDFGNGFLSLFSTGEVQEKDSKEIISVAIKRAPIWELNYKPLFNNEYIFYSRAIPALDKFQREANVSQPFDNVPNFFSGNITDPKKEYIAMENLKALGFEMFDKTKSFDQEHLEFILKTYGKYHALTTAFRKKHFETYQDIVKDLGNSPAILVELVGRQLVSSATAAVNSLDPVKYKIMRDDLRDYGESARETFLKSVQYNGKYKCLIHGDCWSNNMFFKYSESGKLLDIKLIDFQMVAEGSPIHDLAFFFYSGGSKKDFDNLEHYLQVYHESFIEFSTELGVSPDDIISFEDLVTEWKEYALSGVILGTWLWEMKLTPKEVFDKFLNDSDTHTEEEKLEVWTSSMEKIYRGDAFKENTTSILIHAYEYGVLKKEKFATL